MTTLVINSSPNHAGNTVNMAKDLVQGSDYQLLHLNDYMLTQLGQANPADQFARVFEQINQADTVIFGTPIYWHDMTGSLKLLIDRISEDVDWEASHLAGKQVILIAQGAAPSREVLKHCDYMFERFCSLSGMNYLGMISSSSDIAKMKKKAGF